MVYVIKGLDSTPSSGGRFSYPRPCRRSRRDQGRAGTIDVPENKPLEVTVPTIPTSERSTLLPYEPLPSGALGCTQLRLQWPISSSRGHQGQRRRRTSDWAVVPERPRPVGRPKHNAPNRPIEIRLVAW